MDERYSSERAAYLAELSTRMAFHREQGKSPREAAELSFEETKNIRERLKKLIQTQEVSL